MGFQVHLRGGLGGKRRRGGGVSLVFVLSFLVFSSYLFLCLFFWALSFTRLVYSFLVLVPLLACRCFASPCVVLTFPCSCFVVFVCVLARLRLVESNGYSCSRCKWMEGCVGCFIPPDDQLCPVKPGDTVAVDWHISVIKVLL